MDQQCDSCNPNPHRRMGAAEQKAPMMEMKPKSSHDMSKMDCHCGMGVSSMYLFAMLIVVGLAISVSLQSKILKVLKKPQEPKE